MKELLDLLKAKGVVKVVGLFAPTYDGEDIQTLWMTLYNKEGVVGFSEKMEMANALDALEDLFLDVLLEEMGWHSPVSEERGEVTLDLEKEQLVARIFACQRGPRRKEALKLSEVCKQIGVECPPPSLPNYTYEEGEWYPDPPAELEEFLAKLGAWIEENYSFVLKARIKGDTLTILAEGMDSITNLDEETFSLASLSALKS